MMYNSPHPGAMERVLDMPTIGTLNENPLHAALKERYARPGDALEVKLHGYVADVVRDNLCSSSVRMWLRKWLGSRLQRLMPSGGRRSTAR